MPLLGLLRLRRNGPGRRTTEVNPAALRPAQAQRPYPVVASPRQGVEVALLFLFFHKRLRGPLANSRLHHQPKPQHRPKNRLETAYLRADKAIQMLAAA
jgi:hypothetical protein